MDFKKALSLSLGDVGEPVITCYRLGLIVHRLYSTKVYKGKPLGNLKKEHADSAVFHSAINSLRGDGILKSHPSFPEKVYRLLGRKEESVEDVACTIDPFCYVSHLSAMSFHGLTNRIPVKLFVSSPDSQRWRSEALKQMEKDLGDELAIYQDAGLPLLGRVKMLRIDRMEVHRFNSVHWGAYKNVQGRPIRVSTIGRTFLDMLQHPELCGGMHHVLEIFEDHARTYLGAIVGEIDQHGGPIDKVRAGYILDERLGITTPQIDQWTNFAARGGSRKLDHSQEYIPRWSDKWCLSLNVE